MTSEERFKLIEETLVVITRRLDKFGERTDSFASATYSWQDQKEEDIRALRTAQVLLTEAQRKQGEVLEHFMKRTDELIVTLVESQKRSDERLNALIDIVAGMNRPPQQG